VDSILIMVLAPTVAGPLPVSAQENPASSWVRGDPGDLELRASPFDSTEVVLDPGAVKACCSRPRKLDRPIMGRLVPHGEPWRFGANDATAIPVPTTATIDDDVRAQKVGSEPVPITRTVGVVELFALELAPAGPVAAELVMAWDRNRLRIPVVLSGPPDEQSGTAPS